MKEEERMKEIDISDRDRKSTRLNSSHGYISYAVFCLKKKKTELHILSSIHLLASTLPISIHHISEHILILQILQPVVALRTRDISSYLYSLLMLDAA